MKYSSNPYEITKPYYEKLISRRELFRTNTKTDKALHLTFVTVYPLKKTSYSEMVQSVVTGEDLFG